MIVECKSGNRYKLQVRKAKDVKKILSSGMTICDFCDTLATKDCQELQRTCGYYSTFKKEVSHNFKGNVEKLVGTKPICPVCEGEVDIKIKKEFKEANYTHHHTEVIIELLVMCHKCGRVYEHFKAK